MYGIVGYIGSRQAYSILIKGLQRLEYRGYDSAGIALLNDEIYVYKKIKVADLEKFCVDEYTKPLSVLVIHDGLLMVCQTTLMPTHIIHKTSPFLLFIMEL